MKIFNFFKKKKDEDDDFVFPELKPLNIQNNQMVLYRKKNEDLKNKYNIHSEKKGYFIDLK